MNETDRTHLHTPDQRLRYTTDGHLTDQTELARLVREDPRDEVRALAASQIKGQDDLLIHVLATDRAARVRRNAAANLSGEHTLLGLIEDSDSEIRRASLERLDPDRHQQTLARLAFGDPNRDVRLAAIERLTDRETLEKITWSKTTIPELTHLHAQAEVAAACAAVMKIKDPLFTAKVAREHENADVRWACMQELRDPELIRVIALAELDRPPPEQNRWILEHAAGYCQDRHVITRIRDLFKASPESWVRELGNQLNPELAAQDASQH
jgi:hypothetical protein